MNELISRNTEDYLNFWKYFKDTELSTKILINLSTEIENKSDEIDTLWIDFITKHPKFSYSSYPHYASYLALIRNSVTKAEKLMIQYK